MKTIGSHAFYGCEKLKYVIIPEGVTRIESQTLYECKSLIEVIFPSTLTYIGNHALCGDYSLTTLYIPESVEVIGSQGCWSSYISIYCEAESQPEGWESDWNIGDVAMWGCKGKFVKDGIIYLFEQDDQVSIVNYIDSDTEVVIPEEVEFEGTMYPVTKIKSGFMDNHLITSIVMGNNIKTIEPYAFSGMKNLKTIKLSNKLETIPQRAFYGCQSLEKIDIPSSVTTIESYAFDLCPNLEEVYIPKSVISMWEYVFDTSSRTIYCEATSIPESWHYAWNSGLDNVVWNYKK